MIKFALRFAWAALTVGAVPAIAQLPPAPQIPTAEKALSASSKRIFSTIRIPDRPAAVPIVIHVSPQGSDGGDGSRERPFHSLPRAKAAARTFNRDHDVTVRIADGTFRLDAPLRFTPEDGGHNGFTVRWEGEEGAHPVISGGLAVTGWRLADARRGIWSAKRSRPSHSGGGKSPTSRAMLGATSR